MTVYLNNAATTFPKPPGVAEAVCDFIANSGANLSRGTASVRDLRTMGSVFDCREKLAQLFGAEDPALVTFTSNVTEAINTVLKGFLRPGMKVVTSSMEHNAVIRPLRRLEENGVEVAIVSCNTEGYLDLAALDGELKCACLAIFSAASNVCGTEQDIAAISSLCSARAVPLVLDAAQVCGIRPLDARKLGISALCFTGHKGLLGPQGIGGIVWQKEFSSRCRPLIEGGTGSFSHDEHQPKVLPDKFESGTPNLPGIVGLSAALDFIDEVGIEQIAQREEELGRRLWQGLCGIEGVTLYGPDYTKPRVDVIAMNLANIDNADASDILSNEYGIETRPGLHCAPLAHRTLGTFPQGALRLSPGYFNTPDEIDEAVKAIADIARRK